MQWICFFAHDGRVRVKKLASVHSKAITKREADYTTRLHKQTAAGTNGDIELFA